MAKGLSRTAFEQLAAKDPEKARIFKQGLEELAHRRKIRTDLIYWSEVAIAGLTQPGYPVFRPARHHRLMLEKLQAVAEGKIRKLAIFMPPGSAKSSYTSILFPCWFMSVKPKSQVIGASSASNLAEDFSRRTQDLMRTHKLALGNEPINERADLWTCSNGSRYLSAGVGGNITGFRADLAIIDDPVSNRESAYSLKIQEINWGWFRTTLHTRLLPDASVILVQTRWHQDDLAGRILESQGDDWEVLNFPAIWESDEPDILGRKRGELLWPEWQDERFIDDQKKTLGIRDFSAMFQQNPTPGEGSLFKIEFLRKEEVMPPADGHLVRAWDLSTASITNTRDADYTAGVLLQRRPDGNFVVRNVARFKESPERLRDAIMNTAKMDGRDVKIAIPQDPGSAGKYVVADLVKMLAGYNVIAGREGGSKETRAMPVSAQVNAGTVAIVRASWNEAFIQELASFPAARNDDQVDALSRAFFELTGPSKPAKQIDMSWMRR